MENDEIDLLELFRTVWSQRWLIAKITFLFMLLSVLYVLSLDNIYKASVTILPQSQESGTNKFSGLAALAGIDLNSSSSNNEAFYEDVLKSDRVLNKLIAKQWSVSQKQDEVYLHQLLEIEEDPSHPHPKEKQRFDVKKYLRENAITFSSNKDNGLMTLSVSMPLEAKLSADMANYLAEELHEFNEQYRQKKSIENVKSVKKQLDEAKKELTNAENKLNYFQKSNKNYLQSAELQLEYARLQREVLTENTVYTELRKQYEISKIDLEKSKETITILDEATVPVLKDSPRRGLICVVITIFGGVISIITALIKR